MVVSEERKEGGIPSSMYNMAAAVAAQDALSAGKSMDEAISAALVAKQADEAKQPSPQPEPTPATEDDAELRDYLLCICQVLHGRFGHFKTSRLVKIARLHTGIGIRNFGEWASDHE